MCFKGVATAPAADAVFWPEKIVIYHRAPNVLVGHVLSKSPWVNTLPETNIAPQKNDVWNMTFPFGMAYSQGLC